MANHARLGQLEMNFTAVDLKYLRVSLIALGLALLIGGASVWAATYFRALAEKENRTAIAKRDEARSKLARVSQEQQELTEKILLFQELVKRGYTAPEDRLEWIEKLDRLQKTRRLSDFQYEFSAQQPADKDLIPSGASAGGYDFVNSKQRMSMKVLHEGDVWNFISDVRKQAGALVIIDSCIFERLPLPAVDRGTGPYLSADCGLNWITLKERK